MFTLACVGLGTLAATGVVAWLERRSYNRRFKATHVRY